VTTQVRSREFVTDSDDSTIALGHELGREMRPPLLALLVGNLGAGKTTLAKGIVSGLGAAPEEEVTSPSFTLIHEYGRGPFKVFHVDLYRLETDREIATLGLEDLLEQEGPAVVLVEWGEKIKRLFPGSRWEFHLEDLGEERRKISVEEWND
jgi:tRNA threonylcarbamoyladenosine biosynthesis protein TsaE